MDGSTNVHNWLNLDKLIMTVADLGFWGNRILSALESVERKERKDLDIT